MSDSAASAPALPAAGAPAGAGHVALFIGIAGTVVTLVGMSFFTGQQAAFGWLTALVFWTGVALGMLFLIMLTYLFDAGWSVVVRRQLEHGVAAFKWLALLFAPLLLISVFSRHHDLLWKWMNPGFDLATVGGHGRVGEDVLYEKKSAFLSLPFFVLRTAVYFGSWILLAYIFRRNSFAQDADGDVKWTLSSRKWAAAGLALTALTATFAAIDWVKTLEYHWFSTMYGVWYFSSSMRGALATLAIVCTIGVLAGPLRGLVNRAHFYDIGKLMLTFTIFWAYICFSQYFLIWNANIPEETFWYNLRESGDWWYVGLTLVFGHFLVPFLYLLSYANKINPRRLVIIAVWNLAMVLVDVCYNVLPAEKDAAGMPLPFFSGQLGWNLVALLGVGGICAWAYCRSFASSKLIPIHDPRIEESLQHRE